MKKLGLVVFSLLLVVAVWQFDFIALMTSIKQVPTLPFLALLGLQIVSQLLLNYQWCRIGKAMGGEHDFWQMLNVNARGAVVESVTPGVKVGGEVTRGVLLRKDLGYTGQEAATLVTIQKLVSLTSFFLINVFAFTHISRQIDGLWGTAVEVLVYVFLLGFIGLVLALFAATTWLEERIVPYTPKRRWLAVLHGYATTLFDSIRSVKGTRGELFKQFGLSMIIWLLYPVKMILLVHLFTTQYNPIILAEVTFIAYMVGMIPLLPGGLGSFEATMTGLLVAMQIEANQALAITLVFRFTTFWFVILLSLLYTAMYSHFRGEKG